MEIEKAVDTIISKLNLKKKKRTEEERHLSNIVIETYVSRPPSTRVDILYNNEFERKRLLNDLQDRTDHKDLEFTRSEIAREVDSKLKHIRERILQKEDFSKDELPDLPGWE